MCRLGVVLVAFQEMRVSNGIAETCTNAETLIRRQNHSAVLTHARQARLRCRTKVNDGGHEADNLRIVGTIRRVELREEGACRRDELAVHVVMLFEYVPQSSMTLVHSDQQFWYVPRKCEVLVATTTTATIRRQ